MSTLSSLTAFGSVSTIDVPREMRQRTITCWTAILQVLRTTTAHSLIWPTLAAEGPTHSMLTAGSWRLFGLPLSGMATSASPASGSVEPAAGVGAAAGAGAVPPGTVGMAGETGAATGTRGTRSF